ncbi:MAG TPA: aldo/keto reductase, partial [Spirochaetia bacterium]|nr:aldo/keto reductase [Spirochaetia bacterium]
MKFRTLGDSELRVSVIGLGTWAMGSDFFGSVDDQQSIEAIHAALDNGVSLVDTAPAYGSGHSEEVVGKAIAGRREAVVLATKVGTYRRGREYVTDLSRPSIRRQIEESLRRLNVEVIDLYQIHWPDPKIPLEESLEELSLLQKEGKFRYLGVSNFSTELMDIVRRHAALISLQPHYSLLKREIEKIELPYCR